MRIRFRRNSGVRGPTLNPEDGGNSKGLNANPENGFGADGESGKQMHQTRGQDDSSLRGRAQKYSSAPCSRLGPRDDFLCSIEVCPIFQGSARLGTVEVFKRRSRLTQSRPNLGQQLVDAPDDAIKCVPEPMSDLCAAELRRQSCPPPPPIMTCC